MTSRLAVAGRMAGVATPGRSLMSMNVYLTYVLLKHLCFAFVLTHLDDVSSKAKVGDLTDEFIIK